MIRSCLSCLVLTVLLGAAAPSLGSTLSFNDPLHEQQWYLRAMRFADAWRLLGDLDAPREPIIVAVIDSGFDLTHPDLAENAVRGINIVDGSDELAPLTAHGTGTTGPLGAISNNALGISQAAWTARIMPIRVTNRDDARAHTRDIANAIRYAADHGARIINVSYGGVQLDTLDDAGRYAQQRGAVVIMPAGNDGNHHPDWKRQRHLIAVGAMLRNGERARFSNHGPFVDFLAPGQQITSLYPERGYARWDGTSFATPLVASAATLVLCANPELSPEQVYDVLVAAASDDDRHADTLPGAIDTARAVTLALATRGEWARPAQATAQPAIDWGTFRGELMDAASIDEADLHAPQGFATDVLLPGQRL